MKRRCARGCGKGSGDVEPPSNVGPACLLSTLEASHAVWLLGTLLAGIVRRPCVKRNGGSGECVRYGHSRFSMSVCNEQIYVNIYIYIL